VGHPNVGWCVTSMGTVCVELGVAPGIRKIVSDPDHLARKELTHEEHQLACTHHLGSAWSLLGQRHHGVLMLSDWQYWSLLGVAAIVLTYRLHRLAWHRSLRYHNWYCRWVGRPIVQKIWWRRVRRVDECACCCRLIPIQNPQCPHCRFDLREYERAECRCWIRDQIKGLDEQSRALWTAKHAKELFYAAALLVEPRELLTNDIIMHGRVRGLKTNRTTVGPPPTRGDQ